MIRARELLGRLRRRNGDVELEPRPNVAVATSDFRQLADTLKSLSAKKQVTVFELWPGVEMKLRDGLKVTARSKKEHRRFVRPIDPEMLEWFSGFEAGDVFYDVGANCGSLTLAAGAMHRGRVRIVAIEPGYANFESLARNLSQNNMLEYVIPLQIALLDRTGLEAINYYGSTAAGTSLHAVGRPVDYEGHDFIPVETQMIPTYTLDDLINVLKLPEPTHVKIDVDGHEGPLLRGATKTLAQGTVKELLVEIVDHDRAGTRLSSIRSFVDSHGYELAQTIQHRPDDSESIVADYLFRHRSSHDKRAPTPRAAATQTPSQ